MSAQPQHRYARRNTKQPRILHTADRLFGRPQQTILVYKQTARQQAADARHQQQPHADPCRKEGKARDERATDNAAQPGPPRPTQ